MARRLMMPMLLRFHSLMLDTHARVYACRFLMLFFIRYSLHDVHAIHSRQRTVYYAAAVFADAFACLLLMKCCISYATLRLFIRCFTAACRFTLSCRYGLFFRYDMPLRTLITIHTLIQHIIAATPDYAITYAAYCHAVAAAPMLICFAVTSAFTHTFVIVLLLAAL